MHKFRSYEYDLCSLQMKTFSTEHNLELGGCTKSNSTSGHWYDMKVIENVSSVYPPKKQYNVNHMRCMVMMLLYEGIGTCMNWSPLSAAYVRQWTGPSFGQVMACRLFGAKPLPEPMVVYCPLDSWEQASVKFESVFYPFHSRKCIWKCRLAKRRSFCPWGRWVNVTCCVTCTVPTNFHIRNAIKDETYDTKPVAES